MRNKFSVLQVNAILRGWEGDHSPAFEFSPHAGGVFLRCFLKEQLTETQSVHYFLSLVYQVSVKEHMERAEQATKQT